jgi:hypothetical protein
MANTNNEIRNQTPVILYFFIFTVAKVRKNNVFLTKAGRLRQRKA